VTAKEKYLTLHYAANGNFATGQYDPASIGFNLADISSPSLLSVLPSGVKALVYVGMTDGVTASFQQLVNSFAGDPRVYGFYLADEPASTSTVAANLRAESDYIHAQIPGAKTFMVLENQSSNTSPSYYSGFSPDNTHIDLFGIDPYPVQANVPGGYDLNIIPLAVQAAEKIGIPQADLVPVIQAFGGGDYTTYYVPTATQEQEIFSKWAATLPDPAFDAAYSWGSQLGDTALSQLPDLQQLWAAHNSGSTSAPAPDTTAPDTSIGTKPPATTDQTTAAFSWSGTDNAGGSGVDHYLYELDNGGWISSNTTTTSFSGLSNGSHTFQVEAVDAAGNTDATPASYSWTVNTMAADTTAPDTSIGTKPPATTDQTTASFSWSGTDNVGGSGVDHYLYQLDNGDWISSNTTTTSFSGLSNGSHTFQVEAVDAAGNTDATPASYSWTVNTVAQDTSIVGTAAADKLSGSGTNDILVGGGGADTLTGGQGKDTFTYNATTDSTPAAADTITDFTHGVDKIDFTNIAGINASGGVPQFQGNITGNGNGNLRLAAHSVAYIEVGGNTEVLVNTSNAAEKVTTTDTHAADMQIHLVGVNLGLTASDFHHV
jgi:hypothetical protein